MTKKLLFVTTILLVVAFVAFAADVTGKWTYEQPGRNGGPDRQVTITLKDNGDGTLGGSIPAMMGGRGGGGGVVAMLRLLLLPTRRSRPARSPRTATSRSK